jgi:hypothetical protein
MLLVVALPATAQWQFMGLFPPAGLAEGDTLETGNGMHGITVTPDNRVWMHNYYSYARDSILVPDYLIRNKANTADSTTEARYVAVRALHVYNADGTPAPFSPIKVVNIGSKLDTIGFWRVKSATLGMVYSSSGSPNTNRGLRYGAGKVYASIFGQVYAINYQDGVTATKFIPDSANSGVAVGVDSDGNFYWHRVVAGGQPVKIYDNTGNFIGNALDSATGFSRTVLAKGSSGGPTDVYFSDYTSLRVLQLHSDNGILGPFTVADTILKGFACESMEFNPKTGHLWASAGSPLTPAQAPYTTGTHYAYNTTTKTIVDSINWVWSSSADERNRGIAFSTGGDTAYICVFGGTAKVVPGVRRYRKVVTAVETIDNTIPTGYTIEQNYPNPFNPSTEIRFTMAKAGVATIVVYDMLGREIGVLINEFVQAGTHKTTFLGEGLPSGTYIYTLYANGVTVSKKMSLLK